MESLPRMSVRSSLLACMPDRNRLKPSCHATVARELPCPTQALKKDKNPRALLLCHEVAAWVAFILPNTTGTLVFLKIYAPVHRKLFDSTTVLLFTDILLLRRAGWTSLAVEFQDMSRYGKENLSIVLWTESLSLSKIHMLTLQRPVRWP